MKIRLSAVFIAAGFLLIAGALGLFFHNEKLQDEAAKASENLMPQIVEAIRIEQEKNEEPSVSAPDEKEMTVVPIDGQNYLGFIGIPALGLELPVMADWDYEKLKIAPCRYSGSVFTDDFVIMAHNYKKHFGKISDLVSGDSVTFTDMEGKTTYYEVVSAEVLPANAVGEMTAGDFDLTVFTCTYTGESRLAVRCERIPEE